MANYSLSEIDTLTRKATRGAGYSWGIAEEVGKAMRWLSAYGFSGPEILAKHLEIVANKQQVFIPNSKDVTSEEKIFGNDDEPLCSLYCGTLINDLGHHLEARRTLTFNNILSPLLALPSAARIAEAYNISVSFSCAETIVICNPDGITINDTPLLMNDNSFLLLKNDLGIYAKLGTFTLEDKADVICSRAERDFKSTNFPSPQGRSITAEALVTLERFAHQTYAPATDESRLRGAG